MRCYSFLADGPFRRFTAEEPGRSRRFRRFSSSLVGRLSRSVPLPIRPSRFKAMRARPTGSEKISSQCTAAAWVMIILITPNRKPSVTGPAPFLARLRPYSISIARSIWPIRSFPRSFFKVARVAAFLLQAGFPTAHMSSICRATRSPNVERRAADDWFGDRP